jgi:hypothetical protein
VSARWRRPQSATIEHVVQRCRHGSEARENLVAACLGCKPGGVPLVFNMHFTGTMDHWDPLVTDGLAAKREVILFDNAGVSSTSGHVPESAEEMAANAVAFIKALGLSKVRTAPHTQPRRGPAGWSEDLQTVVPAGRQLR